MLIFGDLFFSAAVKGYFKPCCKHSSVAALARGHSRCVHGMAVLLPDLWHTLHLAGFWTWLLYKNCFLCVSSFSCCFFLLPVLQLCSVLFQQTHSLLRSVVYFYIAVTFLQWQSASLLCKKCSVCQEQLFFTQVCLESVFNKKKKSSMKSMYLHDHGGRMEWGPCGDRTPDWLAVSCSFYLAQLSEPYLSELQKVEAARMSLSVLKVMYESLLSWGWINNSSSFREGFAGCVTHQYSGFT